MTGPLLEPGVLPAPLRDGRRLRLVAAALTVLCVGWLAVDAAVAYATRPRIEVEESTVRSPGLLPPVGPPAGTFARDWRRSFSPDERVSVEIFLAGAHVVVSTSAGLRAYDARTGERSWHYREPGRTFFGGAATGGAVVVETNGDLGGRLVGLDADTGRRLWESPDDWRLTDSAAAGVVAVEAPDEPEVLGVDARTGKRRWKSRLYRPFRDVCAPTRDPAQVRATGVVLLATPSSDAAGEPVPCGVVALDAATGETLWSRPLPPDVEPTATSGAVLMETGGSRAMNWEDGRPTVLGRDGKSLFRLPPGASCAGECRLYAAAGRVVLPYEDARSRPRLAVIDLRDGRTRTRPVPSGISSNDVTYASDGARMYALMSVLAPDAEAGENAPLPAGLAVLDVARGTWELSPLPYSGRFPDADGTLRGEPELFGVAGGRLFTVTQRLDLDKAVTLSSYVSTGTRAPTELGGVPARDWPDACALLRNVRFQDWESRAREPDPPLRVGGSTVARPGCARGEAAVRVLWVAATTREADALLDGDTSEVGADEEYTDGRSGTRRIVRVGRTIALVRDHERRESTVRAVVRELRR